MRSGKVRRMPHPRLFETSEIQELLNILTKWQRATGDIQQPPKRNSGRGGDRPSCGIVQRSFIIHHGDCQGPGISVHSLFHRDILLPRQELQVLLSSTSRDRSNKLHHSYVHNGRSNDMWTSKEKNIFTY